MAYFKNFPVVNYRFGDEADPVVFPRLSTYAGAIDELKNNVTVYQEYDIADFERPDTLSYRLYGKSEYYWTFFMMNDHIREGGWPMTQQRIYEYAQELYPNYAIQLDGLYTDAVTGQDSVQVALSFVEGQKLTLNDSSRGTVVRKDSNIAQVIFSLDSGNADPRAITKIEVLDTANDSDVVGTYSATDNTNFYNNVYEYLAPQYYTSGGSRVDINSFDIGGIAALPVTYQEHLVDENDSRRTIRVIKKSDIEEIVANFQRVVKR